MPEHTTTRETADQGSGVAPTAQQRSDVPQREARPSEARPSEARPSEARPSEARPLEARPLEARPLEARPLEARPLEGRSSEAQPSEPLPPGPFSPEARQPAEPLSENQVKLALRRVKDPELNLNIVDLGLIYGIAVHGRDVRVQMTLTSPGCPAGPEIMRDAEEQLRAIPDVGSVAVELVWSPLWSPERIEPRIRAYLGL